MNLRTAELHREFAGAGRDCRGGETVEGCGASPPVSFNILDRCGFRETGGRDGA